MRRSQSREIILGVIQFAGLLAIAAIAPNVIQVFGNSFGNRRRFPSYIQSRVSQLRGQGFIEFVRVDGNRVARLTSKGGWELQRLRLCKRAAVHRTWDGLWRIIVFDIREYKRNTRDKIREDLKKFGFKKLQQSVWVYPHDCEDIILLLKANYHIGRELLSITAKSIENDKWLRRDFGVET